MRNKVYQGFRLAPHQKYQWLLCQEEDGLTYHARSAVLIEGDLNKVALKAALEATIERYTMLRTAFNLVPGMAVPLQAIGDPFSPPVQEHDLTDLDQREQKSRVDTLFREFSRQPFDLEGGRLMRISLITHAPCRHTLFIGLPSLCLDSIGLKNLVREIGQAYEAILSGKHLQDEQIQFIAISEWLNDLLNSEDAEVGRAYWQQLNLPAQPVLKLPFENRDSAGHGFTPQFLAAPISDDVVSKIETLSGNYGASPTTFLLTCWASLLSRLTLETDILVGVTYDGRTYEELLGAPAPLAKDLPIIVKFQDYCRFSDILKRVNETAAEADDWQECFSWEHSFVESQNNSAQPFFPFCFSFEDRCVEYSVANTKFSIYDQYVCADRFKVKLCCAKTKGLLIEEFHYDSSVLSKQEIERLMAQFNCLLNSAVANPDIAISDLNILGVKEQEQVLLTFNRTKVARDAVKMIHELIEEQAERTPDSIAIVSEDQQLSYEDLNARANRLANYLQRLGVGPDVIVGICEERSLEMIIALLGILKAGGAYLPLDPEYPKERLAFMLEDTRVKVLLSRQQLTGDVLNLPAKLVCLDSDWPKIAQESEHQPLPISTPGNLAYVIYTSGSTGRPKGVMISHRGLVNYLSWCLDAYRVADGSGAPVHSSIGFDLTVTSLFAPLLAGRQIIMMPETESVEALAEALRAGSDFSLVKLTPSHLQMLNQLLPPAEAAGRVRALVIGGEELKAESIAFWRTHAPETRLINEYGPTETVVGCCVHEVGAEDAPEGSIPIGRPIANTQLYLLDPKLQPVPIGVVGELYIGGDGLGRGYWRRPELTAERFVPSQFGAEPGGRLYKTGDLARYLPDGTIEYLGRIDNQVKLRGFRIELGEIESALNQHSGVRESIVTVHNDAQSTARLVAYVVPTQKTGPPLLDRKLYRLPNGLEIAHLNKIETDILYQEIFEDVTYLQHGITIEDGYTILDVGANIGLFTLFVNQICRNIRVFAFEPIPPTYEILSANISLYGLNVKPHQCGLSNRAGAAEFTFYPRVSGSSGMYADAKQDENVTRAFLANQGQQLVEIADELMEGRFNSISYTCRLETLSKIISENNIEQIDLLKIDVEKSELDVLEGIEEQDWQKIKQIVIEVHDVGERIAVIEQMLKDRGFNVTVDQGKYFKQTGLYDIYAVHKSHLSKRPGKRTTQDDGQPGLLIGRETISQVELRSYLKDKLPEYMVPSAFMILKSMPLTPNGKADRKALAALDLSGIELSETYVAPRNTVEELLAGIWTEMLRVERVGIHDNFFERGGNSLIATQVVSRIREALKVRMSLLDFFKATTIATQASLLIANESTPGQLEKIARIVKSVEGLTEEQIREALARKRKQRGMQA
jgi:amino acid adenylation domain-containing protein/FkbM family methyltransferase